MSSYEKVVKLACKPKAAAPKAKYIDPIIAATYSDDGAVHDVCRALSPRFREPNVIIVFKALIVLHTMIRNGATDNVLSYLSTSNVLGLHNVKNHQWDGYNTPKNLANYASYLDTRVRAYRDLKHDAIRVQSESNRDARVTHYEESSRGKGGGSVQRSKTVMGRKLRVMTVEKGLLRETKAAQTQLRAVLECKFYLDDLQDELTVLALRMCIKDLLILFQACCEGMSNILENYFVMSHVDAEEALKIYKAFIRHTERVEETLAVAKKLQNLLNVQIPEFQYPPASLIKSLEGYLNDPNFEQNRIEYKASKDIADGKAPSKPSTNGAGSKEPMPTTTAASQATSAPVASSSKAPAAKIEPADFFDSIDPQPANNPTFAAPGGQVPQLIAQQTGFNPFMTMQTGVNTGAFPMVAAQNAFLQAVPTGAPSGPFGAFAQQTNPMQPNPTGLNAFQQPQPTGFNPFPTSPFGQLQVPSGPFAQTQSPGLLQPQPTGANPFRQSILLPQSTGFAAFGVPGGGLLGQNAAPQSTGSALFTPNALPSSAGAMTSAFSLTPAPPATTSSSILPGNPPPARPASTPLLSTGQPMAKPLVAQQTGSRNPFGAPSTATVVPPVPKAPTLQELAYGAFGAARPSSPPRAKGSAFTGSSPLQPIPTGAPPSEMSSIASTFAFKPNSATSPSFTTPNFGGTSSFQTGASPLFAQNTSTTNTSDAFSTFSSAPTLSSTTTSSTMPSLQPQATGFGGIKPFKPTSTFGASLMDSLPPLPNSPTNQSQSPPASTGGSAIQPQQTSTMGALNAQPTNIGAFGTGGLGAGLRPQATGVANPFRASMLLPNSSSSSPPPSLPTFNNTSSFGSGSLAFSTNFNPLATGNTAPTDPNNNSSTGASAQFSTQPGSFGANLFSGTAGATSGTSAFGGTTAFGSSPFAPNQQTNSTSTQQQNAFTSLI